MFGIDMMKVTAIGGGIMFTCLILDDPSKFFGGLLSALLVWIGLIGGLALFFYFDD